MVQMPARPRVRVTLMWTWWAWWAWWEGGVGLTGDKRRRRQKSTREESWAQICRGAAPQSTGADAGEH